MAIALARLDRNHAVTVTEIAHAAMPDTLATLHAHYETPAAVDALMRVGCLDTLGPLPTPVRDPTDTEHCHPNGAPARELPDLHEYKRLRNMYDAVLLYDGVRWLALYHNHWESLALACRRWADALPRPQRLGAMKRLHEAGLDAPLDAPDTRDTRELNANANAKRRHKRKRKALRQAGLL